MKPNGQTWRCIICNNHVKYLHEIFFGSYRQMAIKYNIQVPVCICYHPRKIHHAAKSKYWRKYLCHLLGLDHDKILLALNTRDIEYLDKVSKYMIKKLNSLEV